jgi:hypothetical protein
VSKNRKKAAQIAARTLTHSPDHNDTLLLFRNKKTSSQDIKDHLKKLNSLHLIEMTSIFGVSLCVGFLSFYPYSSEAEPDNILQIIESPISRTQINALQFRQLLDHIFELHQWSICYHFEPRLRLLDERSKILVGAFTLFKRSVIRILIKIRFR